MRSKYKDTYKISTNRLSAWNYSSSGWYFVTICVKDRECVLGKIVDRKMHLSSIGEIVKECWDEIPEHFENVILDEFMIMPIHVNGILTVDGDGDMRRDVINHVSTLKENNPMGKGHLGEIIRLLKGKSSFEIHRHLASFHWQPRYYDHVIRNEISLQKIREYIRWNPLKWDIDEENPEKKLYRFKKL